jgi:hypothetical protein
MRVAYHLAVVALATIVAGCGTSTTTVQPTSTPSSAPSWVIRAATSANVDPTLIAAFESTPPSPDGATLTIGEIRVKGDWALAIAGSGEKGAGSEAAFVIAWRDNGGWHGFPARDTGGFCAVLAKAPAGAITQDERDYFMGCN